MSNSENLDLDDSEPQKLSFVSQTLDEMNNIHEQLMEKHFENPDFSWVKHHTETVNDFYESQIPQLFMEHNPIQLYHKQIESINDYKYRCRLFLGGKKGDKIYIGKPIIYQNGKKNYLYPNEARLKNLTYACSIHYDVEVEFDMYNEETKTYEEMPGDTLEKIYLGKFPIMLHSNLCVLQGLSKRIRYSLGECKNDNGGYFIIDGKEKAVVPQEKFADNMIYIREMKDNDTYDYSVEIRSVSEDSSKPIRTLRVMREISSPNKQKDYFVVDIPNVRKPIPIFILFRALGITNDKKILETILLDLDKNSDYLDDFVTSIYDAGEMFTQEQCMRYIGLLTKSKSKFHAQKILCDYLLPHIGETNYINKAYYLGYMIFELIKVIHKEKPPTDRDHFKFKRVETTGDLMFKLFKEYINIQYKNIFQKVDKEYYYHEGIYNEDYKSIITNNYNYFFEDRIVEEGFRKAFKGNWGAMSHTRRDGVVQDLNRLSFNSALSQLRKLNLPFDSSAKVVGPRLCHGSQYGIIDPVDTPDGGNVGLHKHMASSARITPHMNYMRMLEWLDENIDIIYLGSASCKMLEQGTKLFINGNWIGIVTEPMAVKAKVLSARRIGMIPYFISISHVISESKIDVYTDGGRLIRPILYTEKVNNKHIISHSLSSEVQKKIYRGDFEWNQCVYGFVNSKRETNYDFFNNIEQLYPGKSKEQIKNNKGIIDYIDSSELETTYICDSAINFDDTKGFTHVDIHPALLLGVMGSQVVLPEHNPISRNLFACGQAKQAVSLYHSNFRHRIDKMGIILNYGEVPLLRSKMLKYIQNDEHSHGHNVIVAIMSYNGYNVEDAILFNRGSIDRGLFRTTYYNMYETREENLKVGKNVKKSCISNVFEEGVERMKPEYDYNYLDQNGIVKKNTKMNDKIVLIGKVSSNSMDPDDKTDASVFPKKGQLGYVDKTFISNDVVGNRIGKVRLREERIPNIGDKFCSRCGQKGTIGRVVDERDMPYTKNGVKPDIIINPHAIPSRMTIGQLVECIMGKMGLETGSIIDGTAFNASSKKYELFGNVLTKDYGFHSKGNEILYNGMDGTQIETEIFIGPNYYMRLKHMVKDKINYRARGPRTLLTRQTVQGRANDGGLRVGEMERDAIMSHGASKFLNESMMERGDKYKVAICNKSGSLAVYNEKNKVFMSPMIDGPIKFEIGTNDEIQLKHETKYGRDFSIVEVPYAFKLLMQELMACNVKMMVITEDNVDQLTNILFDNETMVLNDKKIELKAKSMLEEKAEDKTVHEEKEGVTVTGELNKQAKTISDLEELQPEYENNNNNIPDFSFDSDEENEVFDLPDILQTPENLPWKYISRTNEMTGEKEMMYVSLILDENGFPSDLWAEQNPEVPNIYPDGWQHQYVKHYNLDEVRIVQLLKENQTKNNWNQVLKKMIMEQYPNNPFIQNYYANGHNSPPFVPKAAAYNSPLIRDNPLSAEAQEKIASNISEIATKSIDNLANIASSTQKSVTDATKATTNAVTNTLGQNVSALQDDAKKVANQVQQTGQKLATNAVQSSMNAVNGLDNMLSSTIGEPNNENNNSNTENKVEEKSENSESNNEVTNSGNTKKIEIKI